MIKRKKKILLLENNLKALPGLISYPIINKLTPLVNDSLRFMRAIIIHTRDQYPLIQLMADLCHTETFVQSVPKISMICLRTQRISNHFIPN